MLFLNLLHLHQKLFITLALLSFRTQTEHSHILYQNVTLMASSAVPSSLWSFLKPHEPSSLPLHIPTNILVPKRHQNSQNSPCTSAYSILQYL